jgi:hypothetical protein
MRISPRARGTAPAAFAVVYVANDEDAATVGARLADAAAAAIVAELS